MKTVFYLGAAAALLLTGACSHKSAKVESEAQTVDVAMPVVDSVVIYNTYPGFLKANRTVDVVARVDGYLTAKLYEDGDKVTAGQVLFRIEDTNYRDAYNRAVADLGTARSQLEYARTHYEALRQALESEAVSRMEVEQGRAQLQQSQAAVESAEAALRTASTQLGYCTVRAPFTGHVSTNVPSVGAYLSGAGQPVTLATVYEDDVLMAEFSVEDAGQMENITRNLRNGTVDYHAIPLQFSDTLAHAYTGQLSYLAPAVDTSTGTVPLHAVVDNPYGELRPGMYVGVNLPVQTEPRAILIKDAAIGSDQRGSYVYTVNDSDRIAYTPVIPGQTVRDSLRVVTGLSPADRYVTKALLRVRNGMKVKPQIVD